MTTHRAIKGHKEFWTRFQVHHLSIAIKFVGRNLFANVRFLKMNLNMTFNNHTKFQNMQVSIFIWRRIWILSVRWLARVYYSSEHNPCGICKLLIGAQPLIVKLKHKSCVRSTILRPHLSIVKYFFWKNFELKQVEESNKISFAKIRLSFWIFN